jgi:Ubiquitin carboxyl-terminal hydrolase
VPGRISFPAQLPAAALHAAAPDGFGLADGVLPDVTLPNELRPPGTPGGRAPESVSAIVGANAAAEMPPAQQSEGCSTPAVGDEQACRAEAAISAAPAAYDLTAVVVHQGGPQSGHYTTLRRIDVVRMGAALHASLQAASMVQFYKAAVRGVLSAEMLVR